MATTLTSLEVGWEGSERTVLLSLDYAWLPGKRTPGEDAPGEIFAYGASEHDLQ